MAPRPGWTRRDWITLIALAGVPLSRARAASNAWTMQPLRATRPLAQIRRDGSNGLLAVDADGVLWSYAAADSPRKRVDAIDPDTPVAAGQGRIAARTREGGLWIESDGRGSRLSTVVLAPHAGFTMLPFAVIAIAVDGKACRVVRFEQGSGRWEETDRSPESILPDARPLLASLDGPFDADAGELVVFAGPDADRYDHGVLGDRIEPTRLLWLDRHSLRTKRELTLPAPYVFEDIAPRPVTFGGRTGLLTMRSGGSGTRLTVVTTDPADGARLKIAALGPPLDGPHRWMAPTTDGQRLMAVHTPHVGGILNEYRVDASTLTGTVVADQVANHRIHTRELDLSIWLADLLIVPDQDGRRLRVFDGADRWRERGAILLPAQVTMTAPVGDGRFAVLLDDGSAFVVARG